MHTNTTDIHIISATKGVINHKSMLACTVDTHMHPHTMIMHSNHSKKY